MLKTTQKYGKKIEGLPLFLAVDEEGDTHEGYAFTTKTYSQMRNNEMKPFKAAQKNGIDMIMVAHISAPNIIGNNTPSSLSKKMVTGILRKKLGYNGIVVTDALEMGAIVKKYGTKKAAAKAVQAGADILLMPDNLQKAVTGIKEAVKDGRISEEQINQSVKRIVKKKLKL